MARPASFRSSISGPAPPGFTLTARSSNGTLPVRGFMIGLGVFWPVANLRTCFIIYSLGNLSTFYYSKQYLFAIHPYLYKTIDAIVVFLIASGCGCVHATSPSMESVNGFWTSWNSATRSDCACSEVRGELGTGLASLARSDGWLRTGCLARGCVSVHELLCAALLPFSLPLSHRRF